MSPNTPSTALNRVNAVTATDAGATAARAGEPLTACPYDGEKSTFEDFMAHHWLKGHRIVTDNAPV